MPRQYFPLFLAILLVTLTSCAASSTSIGSGKAYLEEVVPPCVPTESEPDPCPVGSPSRVDTGVLASQYMSKVLTFAERLVSDGDILGIPHIVVRGIVQTGSTRCDRYPDVVVNYVELQMLPEGFYFCFVDVAVKEYIVGVGPPVLSVIMERRNVWDLVDGSGNLFSWASYYLDRIKSDTVSVYEGKEMILFLSIPLSIAVEGLGTLGGGDRWFVQQTEDGIRAVAQNIWLARNDEMRSKLSLPLDEMIADIKEASVERLAITGGHMGTDPALPMLVTDANRLREFYTTVGAVYEGDNATVLPPPAPGEDDPPPPTLPANDGTVSPMTPVPGGEPAAPSSTDDAGTTTSTLTAPTTTTAVEDTSTSTTTVEEAEPTTTSSAVVPAAAEEEEEPVFQPADEAVASTTTTEATTTTLAEPTTTTAAEVPEFPTTTVGSGGGGEQVATSILPVEDEAPPPAADDGNQGDDQPATGLTSDDG